MKTSHNPPDNRSKDGDIAVLAGNLIEYDLWKATWPDQEEVERSIFVRKPSQIWGIEWKKLILVGTWQSRDFNHEAIPRIKHAIRVYENSKTPSDS